MPGRASPPGGQTQPSTHRGAGEHRPTLRPARGDPFVRTPSGSSPHMNRIRIPDGAKHQSPSQRPRSLGPQSPRRGLGLQPWGSRGARVCVAWPPASSGPLKSGSDFYFESAATGCLLKTSARASGGRTGAQARSPARPHPEHSAPIVPVHAQPVPSAPHTAPPQHGVQASFLCCPWPFSHRAWHSVTLTPLLHGPVAVSLPPGLA